MKLQMNPLSFKDGASTKRPLLLASVLALAWMGAACGQGGVTGAVCSPGEQADCSCGSEGTSGTRSCDDDGMGWGVCECPGDGTVCEPGAEEVCLCEGGTASGIRSCDTDGSGFGECFCEPEETLCEAGREEACACEAEEQDGIRICDSDGAAWSECDCGGNPGVCDPGAEEACSCAGGESGVTICDEHGDWGECECEPDEPPPPPTWDCSGFDCTAAAGTTTLGRMKELDGCDFELALEEPLDEGKALADALLQRLEDEGLGSRRSLSTVVGNLNREGRAGLSTDSLHRLSGLDPTGFRWNTGDDAVTYWYPQGITGSSDSLEDGLFEGKRLLMVSWYNKTEDRPTRGARISLADVTELGSVAYRHLLLVEPYQGADGPDFGPAEYDGGGALHAGGIAWYGNYLYVADTVQGLRVYDLNRIFRPTNTDDTSRIGISSGRSDAHGYLYAVPRIGRYRLTSDSCRIRFAFIGLNRLVDPPVLVTGEYFSDHPNGRIATWPLNPETHELETREGTTRASRAVVIGQTRAQGSLMIGDSFFVSSSSQDLIYGRLYKNRPGATSASVNWVYGAEDLYWERGRDLIWTPAEHPTRRDVAAVPVF